VIYIDDLVGGLIEQFYPEEMEDLYPPKEKTYPQIEKRNYSKAKKLLEEKIPELIAKYPNGFRKKGEGSEVLQVVADEFEFECSLTTVRNVYTKMWNISQIEECKKTIKQNDLLFNENVKQFIKEITNLAMIEAGCGKRTANKVKKILTTIFDEAEDKTKKPDQR
jgi:hypothetical protein